MRYIKLFDNYNTGDEALIYYYELLDNIPIVFNITKETIGNNAFYNYNNNELIIYTNNVVYLNGYQLSYLDKTNLLLLKATLVIHINKIDKLLEIFNISKSELQDRFSEFDILHDNEIDTISLNSLCDFYNKSDDFEYVMSILKK